MSNAPDLDDATEITAEDADALARVRAGDVEAFSQIYRRHQRAALATARRVVGESAADDAVQVGFLQVLQAVRAGGGPRDHVRAYITTSVRRAAVRMHSRGRRDGLEAGDVFDSREEAAPQSEGLVLDRLLLVQAFGTLPERWRQILWLVDVEGRPLAEVGAEFGLNASAAGALAYRARERLRTAWLESHLNSASAPPECRGVVDSLASWQRGKLTARRSRVVEDHLEDCARCRAVLFDLTHAAARLNQAGLALILAGVVPNLALPAKGPLHVSRPRGKAIVAAAVVAVLLTILIPAIATDQSPPPRNPPAAVAPSQDAPTTDADSSAGAGTGSDTGRGSIQGTGPLPEDPTAGQPEPDDPADGATTEPVAPQPPRTTTPDSSPEPDTTPSPEPTDSSVELDPPTITAFNAAAYHVIPLLEGTGVPGADVELVDGQGAVVATAVVGADGTWSALPEDVPAGDGITFRARHVDGDQVSALSEASGPVDFLAPLITSIDEGDEVPLENSDVNSNGELDDVIVTIVADAGHGIQFRNNGALATAVHEATGSPTNFVSSPQAVGPSTLEIRYVDLDSGAEGAWNSVSFQVIDP
ncbi:sigma-70 family RNA polymerase sigma factor [Ruania halotolerans]|uniref:sigma-70 family RNA polymerase sigma factor n=1 Tax=Ruania halotolerans TaxID=2897773 RepID=UPI001E3A4A9D|nr:sigma-70 family RNA polymerase sigma factor [Ruania halotolerans]UFU05502.1 sigma-70 family RNA polymerase sigma factor [Ruania halotolerans]